MSPFIEAVVAKYGAVLLGLGIGTAAKYGLTISEGRKVTGRAILADILLISMVAVAASIAVDRMGLSGNAAVLMSALFAISSDRVIGLLRERFLRKLAENVEALDGQARAAAQRELSRERVGKDPIPGDMAAMLDKLANAPGTNPQAIHDRNTSRLNNTNLGQGFPPVGRAVPKSGEDEK